MREIIEVSRLGKEPSRIVIGDVVNSLENYLPEGKRVIVIAVDLLSDVMIIV